MTSIQQGFRAMLGVNKWLETDKQIRPERYYFQLACYVRAVEEARAIHPIPRLVYLREQEVVELDREMLRKVFEEAVG